MTDLSLNPPNPSDTPFTHRAENQDIHTDAVESFNLFPDQAFQKDLQEQGYIHVYTGEGKGKTTASLGLIIRALGRGFRVLLVMFTKGGAHYGELQTFRSLRPTLGQRLTIVQAGLDRIVFSHNLQDEDRQKMACGWQIVQQAARSGAYDLLVMDEANIALDLNLIPMEEMKTFLATKPKNLEVVLTGRRAHPDVIEAAHLVSQIQPVKHYWELGVKARRGIEF